MDVHAGGEAAFRGACMYGRLEVVLLLVSLEGDRRVDVHARDEAAFRSACRGDHVEVVRLLLSL